MGYEGKCEHSSKQEPMRPHSPFEIARVGAMIPRFHRQHVVPALRAFVLIRALRFDDWALLQ